MNIPTALTPFRRSRTTWLGYAMLGYHTLLQALISAIVPFLRAELNLNYARAGSYMSANAAGMMLAGLIGDRLTRRFGRKRSLWGAAAATVLGLGLLLLGRAEWITLLGAFACGLFGSTTMVVVQILMADEHDEHAPIALSEANVASGIGSFLSPLLASGAVALGLGWRAAPGAALILLALVALVFGSATFPPAKSGAKNPRGHLPGSFWLMWGVLFLSVAVEWSVIFWSADFMEKIGGVPRTASVLLLSVYFGASILGRFATSRLVRRFPPLQLLLAQLLVSAVGILLVWLVPLTLVRILGLAVCGLSVGTLFPLGVAQAVGAAEPQNASLASARATLAAGAAIFTAPLVMGWAADFTGIRAAYGLTLILLAAALALSVAAFRKA
ncbi:MAG: MFS transporter [Anaerolineae bacterium]|nr:MFS transporter [Anaerolineae bacterium]